MSLSPALVILYVADVARSRAFYEPLFGAPLEATENFAMFQMGKGFRLAVWNVARVAPPTRLAAGGAELCAGVPEQQVDALHAAFVKRGVAIAQAPTRLEFGYSFVALDPDGHRLRVLNPS